MAKLNRERRLIEKRVEKQARKDARKRAAAEGQPDPSDDTQTADFADVSTDAAEPAPLHADQP